MLLSHKRHYRIHWLPVVVGDWPTEAEFAAGLEFADRVADIRPGDDDALLVAVYPEMPPNPVLDALAIGSVGHFTMHDERDRRHRKIARYVVTARYGFPGRPLTVELRPCP